MKVSDVSATFKTDRLHFQKQQSEETNAVDYQVLNSIVMYLDRFIVAVDKGTIITVPCSNSESITFKKFGLYYFSFMADDINSLSYSQIE